MKQLKKLALALVFAMTLAVALPTTVQVVAQAKTITAKPDYKKAPVMKKAGNYTIKSKTSAHAYVAFVAPKTGTYVFTISNIACNNGNTALGNWYIRPQSSSGYPTSVSVKTEGGKTSNCLWTATANYNPNAYSLTTPKLLNRYLKKRSATLKLTAGQKVYSDYWTTSGAYTYKLTIKKK